MRPYNRRIGRGGQRHEFGQISRQFLWSGCPHTANGVVRWRGYPTHSSPPTQESAAAMPAASPTATSIPTSPPAAVDAATLAPTMQPTAVTTPTSVPAPSPPTIVPMTSATIPPPTPTVTPTPAPAPTLQPTPTPAPSIDCDARGPAVILRECDLSNYLKTLN